MKQIIVFISLTLCTNDSGYRKKYLKAFYFLPFENTWQYKMQIISKLVRIELFGEIVLQLFFKCTFFKESYSPCPFV